MIIQFLSDRFGMKCVRSFFAWDCPNHLWAKQQGVVAIGGCSKESAVTVPLRVVLLPCSTSPSASPSDAGTHQQGWASLPPLSRRRLWASHAQLWQELWRLMKSMYTSVPWSTDRRVFVLKVGFKPTKIGCFLSLGICKACASGVVALKGCIHTTSTAEGGLAEVSNIGNLCKEGWL